MATKRGRQGNHAQVLLRIKTKATSDTWESRLTAIDLIRAVLQDRPSEQTIEQCIQLLQVIANDAKWEVRKATVPALVETEHPSVKDIIEHLLVDGNQWVRQAAARAKRKLARITSPGDKVDKRVKYAFDLIKNLKVNAPEEVYEAALLIGEKYYEELAGDTAHELNTFRATTEGLINELEYQFSQELGSGSGALQTLIKMKERFKYLKSLVDGLLKYSRETDLKFQREPLQPIVIEALRLARDNAQIRSCYNQQVEEKVSIPKHIYVETCRPRIIEAFTNIISNAFESFENKQCHTTIQIQATENNSGQIIIEINDSGCGMDSSQIENARKRFRTLKKHTGGIGLGLPLAIKIIEREHNGRLDIQSELNVGTTVIVELPISHEI